MTKKNAINVQLQVSRQPDSWGEEEGFCRFLCFIVHQDATWGRSLDSAQEKKQRINGVPRLREISLHLLYRATTARKKKNRTTNMGPSSTSAEKKMHGRKASRDGNATGGHRNSVKDAIGCLQGKGRVPHENEGIVPRSCSLGFRGKRP